MKIAIDIRETVGLKAGKGWYALNLVQTLIKLDRKNHYLLYTDQPTSDFVPAPRVEIRLIPQKSIFWHLAVIRDLKKEKINLFFAPTSYIIPALLPKKIKSIITVHDLVAFIFPRRHQFKAVFIERLTLKRALKKTRAVFTVSKNTRRDLIKRFKLPEKKIFETQNAALPFIFKPLPKSQLQVVRQKFNLPPKFILAVGTLEPRKNLVRLIKAYAELVKKHPQVKLLIAGPFGWKFEEIFDVREKEKLIQQIQFLGYVKRKDLAALFNLALAFVYPSLYEGFGLPPLEAMQCGCPVVCSNAPALPEVVGEAALTFNPYDEKEIAQALEKIVKHASLRKTLKEKGLKRARHFSWEKSAKTALRVFSKL